MRTVNLLQKMKTMRDRLSKSDKDFAPLKYRKAVRNHDFPSRLSGIFLNDNKQRYKTRRSRRRKPRYTPRYSPLPTYPPEVFVHTEPEEINAPQISDIFVKEVSNLVDKPSLLLSTKVIKSYNENLFDAVHSINNEVNVDENVLEGLDSEPPLEDPSVIQNTNSVSLEEDERRTRSLFFIRPETVESGFLPLTSSSPKVQI